MTARELTITIWILITAGAVGLEVAAHLPARPVSGLAAVARIFTRPLPGRVLVSLGWMWLGWHVFAR